MSTNSILATAPLVTTNFLLRATGTTIGNSLIFDNGTNVGIGNTNTSYTLDVSGTGRFGSDSINGDVTISSNNLPLIVRGRGASSSNGLLFTWDTGAGVIVGPSLQFYTGGTLGSSVGTQRMTITSAGNVGIATTPSSWDVTVFKGLQIANSNAFIVGRVEAASQVQIGTNTYYNADGNWKFIQNGYATRYIQNGGVHSWEYSSASGTAGNNVTFNEAMRITSGGQVGIGTTSWSQPYTKLIVAGAIAYNNNQSAAVSDNSYGQSFAKKIDIVGNSGANTIYSAAGSEGAFYVISGLNLTTGARFVDLVLYLGAASTTPVVVSSQTYLSPGGRTYGNSGENLTLSVTGNTNTYTIRMTGMGANERA
jgi:hypothetical protein